MKQKFIDLFMKWAHDCAELSYCERLKVGCLIVKDDHFFIGYNGTPSGMDNCCEVVNDVTGELKTKDIVLHAEENACNKITRSNTSSVGAAAFCTHSPCIECAKQLSESKIKTVYYKTLYRSDDGLKYLESRGIEVINIKE